MTDQHPSPVSPPIAIHPSRWTLARGLVYAPIPKAACSSVKLALAGLLELDAPDPWWRIHQLPFPTVAPSEVPGLVRDGCEAFAVVRNPWDRLYSCWRSKFHVSRWQDLRQHHDVLTMGMHFPGFVQALDRIDLATANEHLRPQARILEPCGALTILRFETLARDWTLLRRRHPGLPELPLVNVTEHAPYQSAYSEALARRVGRLYREDAELFGYRFGG